MSVLSIENIRLSYCILTFVAIIFGCAWLYTCLTPGGNGIGQDGSPASDITFLKGLYFSVVTISSLGYGDMYPMGWSKVLASVQVLVGLGLVGIMIATVTSQRLSYRVSRLFSSNAQKRLEEFALGFDESHKALSDVLSELSVYYPTVPNQHSPIDRDSTYQDAVSSTIALFSQRCIEIRDYFLDESAFDDYFRSVPPTAVVRVGKSLQHTVGILRQFIIGLPPEAEPEILDEKNKQLLVEALFVLRDVCDTVDSSTDVETLSAFGTLQPLVAQALTDKLLSSAPSPPPPPDQSIQRADESQQTSDAPQ